MRCAFDNINITISVQSNHSVSTLNPKLSVLYVALKTRYRSSLFPHRLPPTSTKRTNKRNTSPPHMAKSKQKSRQTKSKMAQPVTETPEQLYAQAITHLETSDPASALATAEKLLTLLPPSNPSLALPALNLLGEINVELGQSLEARSYFLKAVEIDPEGAIPERLGGGAEKFLWLAQLCEEGGAESVAWFEKGVRALKNEIEGLEGQDARQLSDEEKEAKESVLEEKREKLAEALCGVVEVYMTDLSFVSPGRTSDCEKGKQKELC